MSWLTTVLAQANETSLEEVKRGYGGLIFLGLFVVLLIVVAIWWLRR